MADSKNEVLLSLGDFLGLRMLMQLQLGSLTPSAKVGDRYFCYIPCFLKLVHN